MNTRRSIFRLAICAIGVISSIAKGTPPSDPSHYQVEDKLLRARRELTTATTVIADLLQKGRWPSDGVYVGKVTDFKWGKMVGKPNRVNFTNDPNGSIELPTPPSVNTHARSGAILVLWAGADKWSASKNQKIPFSTEFGHEYKEGYRYDNLNYRGNTSYTYDDPFADNSAFAFKLGGGEEVGDKFLDVQPIPVDWPALLEEAHEVRKIDDVLFTSKALSLEEVARLRSLAVHHNEVVRCLAFTQLLALGSDNAEGLSEMVKSSQNWMEAAIKVRVALDDQGPLGSFLATTATLADTAQKVREGAAMAAYLKIRSEGSRISSPLSDMSLRMWVINHPSDHPPAPIPVKYAEVVELPAVRILTELALWVQQHKKDSGEIIPLLLKTNHLYWMVEP